MGTGGLVLEELPAAECRAAGIDEGELAVRVKGMGQYRPHDAAKRAGFRKGDIIVSFDGRQESMTLSELYVHVMQKRKPGDRVPVTVLRGGRRVALRLPMQK